MPETKIQDRPRMAGPRGQARQAVNLRRLYQLMSAEIESVQEVMTNIDHRRRSMIIRRNQIGRLLQTEDLAADVADYLTEGRQLFDDIARDLNSYAAKFEAAQEALRWKHFDDCFEVPKPGGDAE